MPKQVVPGLSLACMPDFEIVNALEFSCRAFDIRVVPGAIAADVHFVTFDGWSFRLPQGYAFVTRSDLVQWVLPDTPSADAPICQPAPWRRQLCQPPLSGGYGVPRPECSLDYAVALDGIDSDRDGLSDFAEHCLLGTRFLPSHGRAWDTDYDSIPDGMEICDDPWEVPVVGTAGATVVPSIRVDLPAHRMRGGPFVRDILIRAVTSTFGGRLAPTGFPENVQRAMLVGAEPLAFSLLEHWVADIGARQRTEVESGTTAALQYRTPRRSFWFYRKRTVSLMQDARGYVCDCAFSVHACDEPAAAPDDVRGHQVSRPRAADMCTATERDPWEQNPLCDGDTDRVAAATASDGVVWTTDCATDLVPVRWGRANVPIRSGGCILMTEIFQPCTAGAGETVAVGCGTPPAPAPDSPLDPEACFLASREERREVYVDPFRFPGHESLGDVSTLGLARLVFSHDCVRYGRDASANWVHDEQSLCPTGGDTFGTTDFCTHHVRVVDHVQFGATVVHELGHTLSLRHGGNGRVGFDGVRPDDGNRNSRVYNSIMHGGGHFRRSLMASPNVRFSAGLRGTLSDRHASEQGGFGVDSPLARDLQVDWSWDAPVHWDMDHSDDDDPVAPAPTVAWSRVHSPEFAADHPTLAGTVLGPGTGAGVACDELVCPDGWACYDSPGGDRIHDVFVDDLRNPPENVPTDPTWEAPDLCTTHPPPCCGNGIVEPANNELCDEVYDLNGTDVFSPACDGCRGRDSDINVVDPPMAPAVATGTPRRAIPACYRVTSGIDWNNNGEIEPAGATLWRQNRNGVVPDDVAGTSWNLDDICRFETEPDPPEPEMEPPRGVPMGVWTVPRAATVRRFSQSRQRRRRGARHSRPGSAAGAGQWSS